MTVQGNKKKKKNTTRSEHFQTSVERGEIDNLNKYMAVHFSGSVQGTSIKDDEIKLVL